MEWKTTWNDPLTSYVAPHTLIGDKRTHTTFDETIRGMIGAGSLICQLMAAHSAALMSYEGMPAWVYEKVVGSQATSRECCSQNAS